ncbi:MAG: RsbRD N-terminal domain-containing protein [Anaerolineae bacterium]|nr:RsbRD N-terminal domain-containing protein [Anaerolineae bacterium]
MVDLLALIAARETDIIRQWTTEVRALPNGVYDEVDDEMLAAVVRRSHRALLRAMQSGDTARLERRLAESTRQRIEEGVSYADSVLVWLLYRQVVQQVLGEQLKNGPAWEDFVDRVDPLITWVTRTIHSAYLQAGR